MKRYSCLILLMGICFCPRLLAEKYSISGCVKNGAGGSARQVTVLTWKVVTDFREGHNGKTKTDKSNGCYEIRGLPTGTYLVGLKDDRLVVPESGAPQAEVLISGGNVSGIDLRTEIPDPDALRVGTAKALKSARAGFASEKNTGIPAGSYLADYGTGVPAKVLSGFQKCAIHYLNPTEGATATELCEFTEMKKEDESIALFEKIAQSVRSAVADVQGGFRYDELKAGEGGCVDCKRQLEWLSLLNGAVALRLVSSHGRFQIQTYSIQLWLIFSQRITAHNCDTIAKGVSGQIDPTVFQPEITRVTTEVNDMNRKVLHTALRNLLRLTLVGGSIETTPTALAVTEFPAMELPSNCSANAGSVSSPTLAAIQTPQPGIPPASEIDTTVKIPDGAPIRLSLSEALSSKTSKVGDIIHFKVAEDVKVGGLIVVPSGSSALGHILKIEHNGRFGRGGKLDFKVDSVTTETGGEVKVRADSARKGKNNTGKLLYFSPVASPLILMKHGADATVPEGSIVIAYADGPQEVIASRVSFPLRHQGSVSAYADPIDNTPSIISIKSDPTGADISIDSEFVGNTPSTVKVHVGHHTIVLNRPGFKTWQRNINVSSGGTITVDATLEKMQ